MSFVKFPFCSFDHNVLELTTGDAQQVVKEYSFAENPLFSDRDFGHVGTLEDHVLLQLTLSGIGSLSVEGQELFPISVGGAETYVFEGDLESIAGDVEELQLNDISNDSSLRAWLMPTADSVGSGDFGNVLKVCDFSVIMEA